MTAATRFERRILPALFLLSGISGLVYQVVWMRMLIRVFGITIYATSTIVAVFMGGLALGSWAAGRVVSRTQPSLRLYGKVEIGIGLSAAVATLLMGWLPEIYSSALYVGDLPRLGEANLAAVPIRLASAAALLLLPTFLMGATLPIITRWITRADGEVGGQLARYYGLNTLGAVLGVLATGFVAIATLGELGSVAVGVGLNLLVGAVAMLHPAGARRADPPAAPRAEAAGTGDPGASPRWRLYLGLAALSGMCAIGYEILWTRLLILVLGNSVYAFSSMLGTYLIGIALGSLIVSRFADKVPSPALLFGALQAGVAVLGVASIHVFRQLGLAASDGKYLYSPLTGPDDIQRIAITTIAVVLPITLLLGMIFPMLGRIVTTDYRRVGRAVGSLYAWNTVGGVLGALATGYLLIPMVGVQGAFYLATLLNLAIAVTVFAVEGGLRKPAFAAGLVAAGLVVGIGGNTDKDVFLEVIENRLVRISGQGKLLFHHEDTAATVTGYLTSDGRSLLLINGIIVSGKGMPGALMAHVPLLLHEAPERALIICFGVGTTFSAAVEHGVAVDAVELVEGVVRSFPWWEPDKVDFLTRDDVRIFINDGRNYLLLAEDKYDLVVVDAAPPIFSEGTVNLYSAEFMGLVQERLTDDGIFMLWIPTPCFEHDFWTIARNFDDTFEHIAVWSLHDIAGVLVMGSNQPLDMDPDLVVSRMRERGMAEYASWLTPELYTEGLVMTPEEFRAKAREYAPVTDGQPRTEYPLGRFVRGERFWNLPGFMPKGPVPAAVEEARARFPSSPPPAD